VSKSSFVPFLGVLFATATNMLMQTAVATILPQIIADFGGGQLYGWVFSIFLLASTVTIPLFSKLADAYGYKKFFVIGMTVFLVGSLLCGLSDCMPALIAARLVQGLGAEALGPVTIALISHLFVPEERGKAMGIYAATQLLANVAGPVVGGVAAQSFGWEWAFYMGIPFGLISIYLIHSWSQPFTGSKTSAMRLDWPVGTSLRMLNCTNDSGVHPAWPIPFRSHNGGYVIRKHHNVYMVCLSGKETSRPGDIA
jgi:MFS family permease